MIKHITLINFKDGTTAEQKQAVEDVFNKLPDLIPELRSFSVGQDLGLLDGNSGFAVVGDFDNKDDFLVYSTHQAHMDVIYPVCGELMAGYSTAQFSY